MNFRKASLIALSVTLFVGLMFFVLSLGLPMSSPGVVIGPGYYPRVLSILLIVSSMIGLYKNYRNKDTNKHSIDIPKPKLFFLVLSLGLIVATIWHITRRFYPVAILSTLLLLWFLNPESATPRKAVKTIILTFVIIGILFILFSLLLQLNL